MHAPLAMIKLIQPACGVKSDEKLMFISLTSLKKINVNKNADSVVRVAIATRQSSNYTLMSHDRESAEAVGLALDGL